MKFLHAADLHLDSPLRGLSRYEGAPEDEIRQATRKALRNLVELAVAERVDFVLIAGDVYDGDWQDYQTGLFFIREMSRLKDAGIPVVLIRGNHDAASRMTNSLRLPPNITLLDHAQPQTVTLDGCGVAIHGQSFAKQAVTENLVLNYPPPRPGLFNIGMLHTSLTGSEEHDTYAPCTPADLLQRGYDYWALGHVHQRRTVNKTDLPQGQPPIVFSGNIQGRHIREPGPRGCYLVTVDAQGSKSPEFRALDVFRWETCALTASANDSPDDVLGRFETSLAETLDRADDRPLAVRVEVRGRCLAHADFVAHSRHWIEEFRNTSIQSGQGRVWLEKVIFATSPPAIVGDVADDGPLDELRQLLAEVRQSPDLQAELLVPLGGLLRKLPTELTRGPEAVPFAGESATEWLMEVLENAEPLLAEHLRGGNQS